MKINPKTLWSKNLLKQKFDIKKLTDPDLDYLIKTALVEIKSRPLNLETNPNEGEYNYQKKLLKMNLALLQEEQQRRNFEKNLKILNRQLLANIVLIIATLILGWATYNLWTATQDLVKATEELNFEKPSIFTEFQPFNTDNYEIKLQSPKHYGNIWIYNNGKFDVYLKTEINLFLECDEKKEEIESAKLDWKENILSTKDKRILYKYTVDLNTIYIQNYQITKKSNCKLITDDTTISPFLPIKSEIKLELDYLK